MLGSRSPLIGRSPAGARTPLMRSPLGRPLHVHGIESSPHGSPSSRSGLYPSASGCNLLCQLRAVTLLISLVAALFFVFNLGITNHGVVFKQGLQGYVSNIRGAGAHYAYDDPTRTRYTDRVWVGKRFAPHDLEEQCANDEEGVRGYMKNDALLTMIVLPKNLGSAQKNSGGELHLRHIMYGWSNLPRVNFLVMSSSCAVLKLADEYGLPTVKKSSGSDVGDLTYRHLLRVVNDVSKTPFVGYVNSDIVFDEGLPQTIAAAIQYPKNMTIIGHRYGSDVPLGLFAAKGQDITPRVWNGIVKHMHATNVQFSGSAEDYFIFSRNGPLQIDKLPPFFVGGVAFDNFLSQLFWQMDNAGKSLAVDASSTMKALHINHGKKNTGKTDVLMLSHVSVGSDFNRQIMKGFKFIKGHGQYIVDTKTITTRDVQGNIVFMPRPLNEIGVHV